MGWPKGKPRKNFGATGATAAVDGPNADASPVRKSRWEMKAGANWETNDVNAVEGPDRLHIPQDQIPDGMDLMWVTDSVLGQPVPQHRAQFERKGWTPVHTAHDFDGRFDGRFTPKGQAGECNVDGLVLMARPLELTRKALDQDKRRARDQVRIKEQALYGGDIGASGADHPSARNFNHINRSVERIDIPRDDS